MRNLIYLAVWLLGMSTTFAQNWVPIYGPSYGLTLESSNTTYGSKVVTYNGQEVLAVYGDWDAVKDVAGEFIIMSSNIVFWDGTNWFLPDYPYWYGKVYDVANDATGELYIATDVGVLKEQAGSWYATWGTTGHVGALQYDQIRSQMIFSEEHIVEGNSWSKICCRIGNETTVIADVQCRVGGYDEITDIGVFGMVPGEGAFAGLPHTYGIDLEDLSLIGDFPQAPNPSGAFAVVEASATELFVLSTGPTQFLSSFDGTSWKSILTISLEDGGLGPCYDPVNNKMYLVGSYDGYNIYELDDAGQLIPFEDENGNDGIVPRSVVNYENELYAIGGSCFDYAVDGELIYSTTYKLGVITDAILDLEAQDVSIFPNPASETVHITGIDINDPITIHNVVGQKFDLSKSLDGDQIVVDIKSLPEGIYFINNVSFMKN